MLLRAVNDVVERHAGGHGWVRLMYAYPSTFNDEMIDAIAGLPHIVKYVDMPLQHASDRMLKAMGRNVTTQQQEDLLAKLRERCPEIALRTTLITGFPGETQEDHEQLLSFVERTRFDALGVFEYSREPGTRAGTMDLDEELHVPDETKARRKEEIMLLQQRIAFERGEALAQEFDEAKPDSSGRRLDVLIDAPAQQGDDGYAQHAGRTAFQAPDVDSVTYVHTKKRISPGELIRCVVVDSDGYDLVTRPVEEVGRNVSLPVITGP